MERTSALRSGRDNRELIEARLNAGLTPNDLARRALISGNTVRNAEAGVYIDPRSQKAIADALGFRTIELFPFDRQRRPRRRRRGPARDAI